MRSCARCALTPEGLGGASWLPYKPLRCHVWVSGDASCISRWAASVMHGRQCSNQPTTMLGGRNKGPLLTKRLHGGLSRPFTCCPCRISAGVADVTRSVCRRQFKAVEWQRAAARSPASLCAKAQGQQPAQAPQNQRNSQGVGGFGT